MYALSSVKKKRKIFFRLATSEGQRKNSESPGGASERRIRGFEVRILTEDSQCFPCLTLVTSKTKNIFHDDIVIF